MKFLPYMVSLFFLGFYYCPGNFLLFLDLLPYYFLLHQFFSGYIICNSKVLNRVSFTTQKRNYGGIHPIEGAIFCFITKFTSPYFAFGYHCPHIFNIIIGMVMVI